MEALIQAPMPAFELLYNGRAMTADISPYVVSITYTDQLSGSSDTLDIEIEDSDGRWLDSWFPQKGAKLEFRFGYHHLPLVSAGTFDLDELTLSGPPSRVSLRAKATGAQKAVRTRNSHGYENTTLLAVAQRVAKRLHMKLIGKIEPLKIDRVTQYQEGDLAFLHRLAGQYGYAFKVTDNNTKMVFWKTADLSLRSAIRRYAPGELTRWSFRDSLAEAPAAVKVSHHNPATRQLVQYETRADDSTVQGDDSAGQVSNADTVHLVRRAPNKASAEAQGKAAMDARMLERTTGNLTLEGDPLLAAGQNIELTGLGLLSGIYTISRATHSLAQGSGYTTELELKRSAPAAKKAGKPRRSAPKPPAGLVSCNVG